MLGPRIDGERGVSLLTPTLEELKRNWERQMQPEPTRFWGVRVLDLRPEHAEKRFKAMAEDQTQVVWHIAYQGESIGFAGLFRIDWIARQCESGIFIGRHELYGKGIASEVIRLRTRYAWDELRLRRVYNWIALRNRGSRRANEKAGYRQMGRFDRSWFRSGQWHDEWLGEIFAPGEAPPGWG